MSWRWAIQRGSRTWSKRWPVAIERPQRFFFYGTLIGVGPPPVRRALARLRDLGPARAEGLVYAICDAEGWYPALIEGPGEVAGRLYETSEAFTPADLAALDAYEDYDPADPAGSLYRRVSVGIAGRTAELYRFNQPLPEGACPIPDGDFAVWVEREGGRPFGG